MSGSDRQRSARPSPHQVQQRRRVALGILLAVLGALAYLALAATVFAPLDRHGTEVTELRIRSQAVGRELRVNVLVPAAAEEPAGQRPLLVFLHGRGGNEDSFIENEAVYEGLARLGAKAPIVAFPDGGDHSYWHNRREGRWGRYVVREAIPAVVRRFGVDPDRVAIGGISMGGFGAYDLALLHPGRFCAVGGHSAALWFEGSETAPGAFESAGDFARNDVVGMVRADPGAFSEIPIWNDYGSTDPFRIYNEGFVDLLEAGDADFRAHRWPGGHDSAYWNAHWSAYLRFYAKALARC